MVPLNNNNNNTILTQEIKKKQKIKMRIKINSMDQVMKMKKRIDKQS